MTPQAKSERDPTDPKDSKEAEDKSEQDKEDKEPKEPLKNDSGIEVPDPVTEEEAQEAQLQYQQDTAEAALEAQKEAADEQMPNAEERGASTEPAPGQVLGHHIPVG